MYIIQPFDWIVSHSWWRVLIIALTICPVIPFALEWIQFRKVIIIPWGDNRDKQFYAFLPGNIFLAVFLAANSVGLNHPGAPGWWQSPYCSLVVGLGAFTAFVGLNVMDYNSFYTIAQLRSCFKIYHNLLYFWYGYLQVSTFIGMFTSTLPEWYKLVATIPGLAWAACLLGDNLQNETVNRRRMYWAHSPQPSTRAP